MKNGQLSGLMQGINSCGNLSGFKFAYAMAKNKKAIESEIQTFDELLKADEKLTEYENRRVKLCEKYAKKDENGKVIMIDVKDEKGNKVREQYDIEDEDKFIKETDKLGVEYKEVLDERKEQIKKFNEFMLEDSTVELYKVKEDNVPEDITSAQLNSIFDLIEE